jgi:hypothetical protein
LLWPSIVAALMRMRHGPARSSAARRNTAARASQRIVSHSRRASVAAAIAWTTWPPSQAWNRATTWRCACGMTTSTSRPVVTRWPPITAGTSGHSPASCSSDLVSRARSGLPGA